MKLLLNISLLALFLLPPAGFSKTYSTHFDGTENPLSEGGVWHNAGLDWKFAQKSNGNAFGTQTGTGGYDDSYALLSGFGADQTVTAVVHRAVGMDVSCTREAELLLHFTDAAHSARGYECLFAAYGGIALVSWNGAIGDFTVLNPVEYGSATPVQDGDTLKASVISNVITMYVNGVKRAQLTDSRNPAGSPGIGFFRRECGANSDYGFKSFTATDGNGTAVEAQTMKTSALFSFRRISPNPFNAITTLNYVLSSQDFVSLKVFDVVGREIATLVNERKSAGNHFVRFDGARFPDGIYTARMASGGFDKTVKLILLK